VCTGYGGDSVEMDFLSKRIKEIGLISIILIIVFSFGLLFYVQNLTERDIKYNLLLQQKQRQIGSTRDISLHIGSDLNLVIGLMDWPTLYFCNKGIFLVKILKNS
jgi:hypothetical protein